MEYFIVNSFTKVPFQGNPAGVVVLDDFFEDSLMQNMAKQLNLVETVFVKKEKETSQFTMRYFTPTQEVGVAGHPTVAALKALHEFYGLSDSEEIVINTTKGCVIANVNYEENNKDNPFFSLLIDNIKHIDCQCDDKAVLDALELSSQDMCDNLPIQIVDSGLGHIVVPLKSLDSLFKAKRNIGKLKTVCTKYGAREAQLFTRETFDKENDIHTRNICPREGIEDPACGIGNSALLAYFSRNGFTQKQYNIEQGYINNFKSVIKGSFINDTKVMIGGNAFIMAKGAICY